MNSKRRLDGSLDPSNGHQIPVPLREGSTLTGEEPRICRRCHGSGARQVLAGRRRCRTRSLGNVAFRQCGLVAGTTHPGRIVLVPAGGPALCKLERQALFMILSALAENIDRTPRPHMRTEWTSRQVCASGVDRYPPRPMAFAPQTKDVTQSSETNTRAPSWVAASDRQVTSPAGTADAVPAGCLPIASLRLAARSVDVACHLA